MIPDDPLDGDACFKTEAIAATIMDGRVSIFVAREFIPDLSYPFRMRLRFFVQGRNGEPPLVLDHVPGAAATDPDAALLHPASR